MKTTLTENQRLVVSSNEQLERYLESLLKAKEHTPRSWLYENTSPEEVLESWMHILSRLADGDSFEKKVFQFDTSQLKKWGPQGGHPPISDVMEIVEQGFGSLSSPEGFSDPEWSAAKAEAMGLWSKHSLLRPASYKHVLDDMRARDVLESNSGWPDFARRNIPEVKTQAIADAESLAWQSFPAIALFRNYNLKLRLVWMFPMAANLVEGSFTQPLQQYILRVDREFVTPWVGFEAVRSQVSEAYAKGCYLSASDFSSTDAHFGWRTTEQVFEVIKTLFQAKCRSDLHSSLKYMHTIPLIIGPDQQLTGWHGVSSGSNWTNLIETLFDRIFALYVQSKVHGRTRGLCAIGDDMSWISDRYNEEFSSDLERLGELVGQDIKAEKTTNDKDSVKFLQRLFQRGYNRPDGLCRGVYSTIRALKSSIYPERFHKPQLWSSDMFCARQYMILENCVDHPLFEDFVKFVVHGQKDLIPFAHKSARELDEILRKTKLLPGFNPTYNQERRDASLSSFESISIASKL